MKFNVVAAIFKRNFVSYFSSPLGYVFICAFVLLSAFTAFWPNEFFNANLANLDQLNKQLPWIMLAFVPAVTMSIWAQERQQRPDELLLTLPISIPQAVVAKFLAAWVFSGIALAFTFPIWWTVNFLGDPDNGVIVASYVGSMLMAGAFLAIGACVSSLTKNQVIAFVITAVVCLIFVLSGYPLVLDFFSGWAPQFLVETISSFSFLSHFNAITKGVIDLRDFMYFVSLIAFWLFANAVLIELKKAD